MLSDPDFWMSLCLGLGCVGLPLVFYWELNRQDYQAWRWGKPSRPAWAGVRRWFAKLWPKPRRYPFNPDWAVPPGQLLREYLQDDGISFADFCERAGLTNLEFVELLTGDLPITPELAARFEALLEIPAKFWLAVEKNYRASQVT
jgi:plasmid maintenance system antidote protein VapI